MIQINKISEIISCLNGMQGVVFDLDDTLYSEKEYINSGYNAVAELLPQISDCQNKLWEAFEQGYAAIDEVLRREDIWSEDLKKSCLITYRNHIPKIHLYEGVCELLNNLRSFGFCTGIITDGRPEGQRAKLAALGLRQYIDNIIITDELGGIEFRKPNKLAFEVMQQRFKIPFDRMCYIGDNVKKDFIAPWTLGMRCIHFNNSDGLYCN